VPWAHLSEHSQVVAKQIVAEDTLGGSRHLIEFIPAAGKTSRACESPVAQQSPDPQDLAVLRNLQVKQESASVQGRKALRSSGEVWFIRRWHRFLCICAGVTKPAIQALQGLGIRAFLQAEQMSVQGQFDFEAGTGDGGYAKWLAGRQVATEELARRMNLPLGHEVEVWLYGGVRLRGRLRLQTEVLFVEEERVRHLALMVDGVPFVYREMESCVRLD
jgi:hypothetical protein